MKLVYSGPKAERVVEFPIPFLSKGLKEGEVRFLKNQPTECPEPWAGKLLEMVPEYFAKAQDKPQPVKG